MPGYWMSNDPDDILYNYEDHRADRDVEEGAHEHDAQPQPDDSPASEDASL